MRRSYQFYLPPTSKEPRAWKYLGLGDDANQYTSSYTECPGMDASISDPNDGCSDYGSDLNADEEDILNGLLLQQCPPNFITDSNLLLADIEDDEKPRTARARISARSGREVGEKNGEQHEAKLSVEIESKYDSNSSTNCKFPSQIGWRN